MTKNKITHSGPADWLLWLGVALMGLGFGCLITLLVAFLWWFLWLSEPGWKAAMAGAGLLFILAGMFVAFAASMSLTKRQ